MKKLQEARRLQTLLNKYINIYNETENLKTDYEFKDFVERRNDLQKNILLMLPKLNIQGITKNTLFRFVIKAKERGFLDKLIT